MAAVPWPVSLPQYINVSGFGESIGETVIRTEVDVGPVKKRRRFTRSVDRLSCSIDITKDQRADFLVFYKTTTDAGVLRFEMNHPITGVLTEFTFAGPPNFRAIGGLYFQAIFELEEMPMP